MYGRKVVVGLIWKRPLNGLGDFISIWLESFDAYEMILNIPSKPAFLDGLRLSMKMGSQVFLLRKLLLLMETILFWLLILLLLIVFVILN